MVPEDRREHFRQKHIEGPGPNEWDQRPMARAEQYWAYARECEYRAADMDDEQDRLVLYDMARAWADLALKEQATSQRMSQSPALPSRE
jgi:hypothetical protein